MTIYKDSFSLSPSEVMTLSNIPIVSVTQRENRLGGAANVSLNLQALGATPYLFAVIGNDDKGRKFRKLLEKKKLSCEGVFIDPKRNTTLKTIFMLKLVRSLD